MSYVRRTLLVGAVLLSGCGDETQTETSGPDEPATSTSTTGGGGDGVGTSSSTSGSGGEGGQGGDAGQGGEGGSPEPDPAETIIVFGDDGLQTDVPIVVHDQDGEVVSVGQTNAGGALEVNVPPGGAVTALQEGDVFYDGDWHEQRLVYTDFDVPPGSTVVFELYPLPSTDTSESVALTLHLQNYPLDATSATIWACGQRLNPTLYYPAVMNIPFAQLECAGSALFMVVVLKNASGAPIGMRTGWVNNPASTVDYTFSSYDPPSTVTMTWAPVPSDITSSSAAINVEAYGQPVLSEWAPLTPGTGGSMVFPVLPDSLQAEHAFYLSYSLPNDRGFSRTWASTTSPVNLALGPPSVDAPDALGLPNLSDIARPRFSWNGDLADQAGDVTRLQAYFGDDSSNMTFVAKGPALEDGEYRFPALPAELAEYAPSSSLFPYAYSVERVDYDDVDGYVEALGEVAEQGRSSASAWRAVY